ncbi:hypothetical protein [Phormidium sp. CCY1219]|uniref:hypothetical protein n=1 Tax=Phormidium sp. CCY1219 TaxID=2886104 RepID=UPI002D77ED3E|nr:hypothetical protein [Phormidium sp. CCY1219]
MSSIPGGGWGGSPVRAIAFLSIADLTPGKRAIAACWVGAFRGLGTLHSPILSRHAPNSG